MTNHSFFMGNFKISMRIYENQLFSERASKIWTRLHKIICFSKEQWHRGGTGKIEKSAGRAASAIGVLRFFKSNVFAWRSFDFFGTATNEIQVFRTKMTKLCFRLTFFRLSWDSYERNDRFLIENWNIEEEEKSAGRAASAIGVLRIFKSSVFAWRFFDFLGIARSGMIGFKRQNWHRGGTESEKK